MNEALTNWSTLLTIIIDNHAPMQTMKISNKLTPRLTSEFKKLARTRDKLKSAAVKNKSTIIMESYKQLRKANNLNNKLKRGYFFQHNRLQQGKFERHLEVNNFIVEQRSKTTNIVSPKTECQDVVERNDVAPSMNKFFCIVGHKLSDNIPHQANPLLSNEYLENRLSTHFRFRPSLLLVWRGL